MKKFFALALIAVPFALAIPAPADASPRDEGTSVRRCESNEYGRWCQTIWTSNDGVVQRGHWTWESRDGTDTSRGWWRTNYAKGISFGQSFYQWFYRWFNGGKG